MSYIRKKLFHRWTELLNGFYKTINDAQKRIETEVLNDRAQERRILAKQGKVIEEYKYKMVPNHIPNEQIGTFLTIAEREKNERI